MQKAPKLVSLFPYQIKDRESFYQRSHPTNLHPDSLPFRKYWNEFIQKCVEGLWVKDKDKWVFMPPKLFFYINYTKISSDKERKVISPRLRDNEWIIFTYILCVDGFSGFELDEEYTCHEYIRRWELGQDPKLKDTFDEHLDEIEFKNIPESCKKQDGTFKKYVNAWDYLTKHYLIDNSAEKPLGQALYENQMYNGCILSARGVGKSFTMFMGDFLHEFLFNGVRRVKDLSRVNDKLLFGMGASDGTYISKSIKNVSSFYDKMPGQYRYADPKKRKYMGPLYKLVQGTWKVGEETTHIVKFKNGRTFIDSSVVYISVLTKDKSKIGAGDRFRRVYIEEFGFLEEALEVHSANKDSLISEGIKVGSVFYTGTGGDLKKVKEPKKIFDNPRAYDIFGIPNYWENASKKTGLFIPVHYAKAEYKDENGNTRLEFIHKALLDQRKKNIEEMDSISYDTSISYNPMEPKEILRSNSGSLMPKREAQDQLSRLDTFDIFRKKAQIGSLVYKPTAQYGVDWEKDMENKLRPILDLDNEDTPGFSKEGAWIIFEQPPQFIPEGLYWIIYDPAKKSGDGESYHSILVYKSFYIGSEQTLYDTIVAEMICRKETLEENYQEVIKAARYFNAKIFPEINVAGFVEWCKDKKLWYLLEADAYNIEKEISPDAKRSYYRVGVDMNSKRKKQYAFRKLRDWLLDVKESDPLTGIPVIRTIDWIFSKRILNEMISFEEGENFDHISSLLCLMILLGKIQGWVPEIKEEEDYLPSPEEQYLELQKKYANAVMRQQRPAILQY